MNNEIQNQSGSDSEETIIESPNQKSKLSPVHSPPKSPEPMGKTAEFLSNRSPEADKKEKIALEKEEVQLPSKHLGEDLSVSPLKKRLLHYEEGPVPQPLFMVTNAFRLPNEMTSEFRRKDPKDLGFATHFKGGYLPIQMQQEMEKQESKSHFIRTKQTSVNIKRCCGVTYVLPSESKQEGASGFSPLPPLAFQVGTVSRLLTETEKKSYSAQAKVLVQQLLQGLLRVTVQAKYGETELKHFILGESQEGEEVFVDGVHELWRLLDKDNFCVFHLDKDRDSLFCSAMPNTRGQCFIGLLVKKGLCGTRSVKKCLELPEEDEDTLNTYASQIRVELYVSKDDWKQATLHTQKMMCAFIQEFEETIRKALPEWNKKRDSQNTRSEPCLGLYKWIKSCKCPLDQVSRPVEATWTHSLNVPASLTKYCLFCLSYNVEERYSFPFQFLTVKHPPFYIIHTRDSFSYDLEVKETYIGKILKKEYYFRKEDMPMNYKDWEEFEENGLVRVGITTYSNVFSQEDLLELERKAGETEESFKKGQFLPHTAQSSYGSGTHLKRTKFFFGARYMWTGCQLAEPQSKIAAGVRTDVSAAPVWMQKEVVQPLVEAGVIEEGFVNSIAMNIYHDGKEGLAQHFDDAVRFKQPIFTVKLGSDSRLSFGTQLYGFLNGAFTIPCPRGIVCVMEELSYAANRAKHCVRPCDMTGRSITMILRQIHPFIMEDALKYDQEVDLPTWMSTLSMDEDSVPYFKQKEDEAKKLLSQS